MSLEHLKDKRRNSVITASVAYNALYERVPLWETWTWRREPFKGNHMTQWGIDNEHKALAKFELMQDVIITPSKKFLVHQTLPFGATPDGFIEGIPVEVKCPYTQRIYPEIPERYWFQMQLQMSVTEKDKCWFVCWTPDNIQVKLVNYDNDFIEWYLPFAEEFLECVKTDTKPKRWSKRPMYNHKEKY